METLSFAELKEQGQRLYQAKEFAGAADAFRRAKEMTPTSAEVWRLLGFALTASNEHREAVGAFQSAIGLDPQNAEGFFGVGTAYAGVADFARAISALDEALNIKPNMMPAKTALVGSLIEHARLLLGEDKTHEAEAALDRAYKLDRTNPRTVLPYVQQMIVAGNHKRAFEVINVAKAESKGDQQIVALANKMDSDPKLAHAKQLQALKTGPKQPLQPSRPTTNPDEVPCPCGAIRVMKWATVCPNCNQQIGDPANRMSQFAGHEKLRGYTWIDVCYYIVASLWLLYSAFTILLSFIGSPLFAGYFMVVGMANAVVALGLLFQVGWLQYIGKILMILNFVLAGYDVMLGLGAGWYALAARGFFTMAFAGFSWWLINQMSD